MLTAPHIPGQMAAPRRADASEALLADLASCARGRPRVPVAVTNVPHPHYDRIAACLAAAAEELLEAKNLLVAEETTPDEQPVQFDEVSIGHCTTGQHIKRAVSYRVPGTGWTSWYVPQRCSCQPTPPATPAADPAAGDSGSGSPSYTYVKVADFDTL